LSTDATAALIAPIVPVAALTIEKLPIDGSLPNRATPLDPVIMPLLVSVTRPAV